jgi:hypothetical protein
MWQLQDHLSLPATLGTKAKECLVFDIHHNLSYVQHFRLFFFDEI